MCMKDREEEEEEENNNNKYFFILERVQNFNLKKKFEKLIHFFLKKKEL